MRTKSKSMKIKRERVVQAFLDLTESTTNKFWGFLCALQAIENCTKVESGNTYKISSYKLSKKLQELFFYGENQKENNDYYFVHLSKYWVREITELKIVKEKVSIEQVVLFYYKDKLFSEGNIHINELVTDFLQEIKLSSCAVDHLFVLPKENYLLEFESDYDRVLIFESIKSEHDINSPNKTLTFEQPFTVTSHAGELQRAPFFQTLYSGTQIQRVLLIAKCNFSEYYMTQNIEAENQTTSLFPQNYIYYGPPGTGKSYKIKNELLKGVAEEQQERITFHPDYDHAAFVGSYMPKSDQNDNIIYKFVPQAFTNIYVKAWQNPEKAYYLIIEEINRGNCAEIFGDIFQLLDRKGGYSVSPKAALKEYLIEILGEEHKGIKDGKIRLPNNLQLLATMNTSDQSLFPMDSAFKRRWSWKYVPINYDRDEEQNKSASFEVDLGDGRRFKWLDFIEKINIKIKEGEYLGEDKCIGNYFISPEDNLISLETFINKAIFYLWIDVFKEEEDSPFSDLDGRKTYSDFFPEVSKGKKLVEIMLEQLKVQTYANDQEVDEV